MTKQEWKLKVRERYARRLLKIAEKRSSVPPMSANSNYDPSFPDEAYIMCSEKGYLDSQLAEHFMVGVSTVKNWKKKYPEFADAIQRGIDMCCSRQVEGALLKRAVGYDKDEKTVEYIADKDGNVIADGNKKIKIVSKHFPPDVTAATKFLQERDKARWGGIKVTDVNINIHDENLLPNCTDEELKVLESLAKKMVEMRNKHSIEGSQPAQEEIDSVDAEICPENEGQPIGITEITA